jgi:hypothetical protein
MENLIYLFAASVGVVAVLATIAIWSPRRTRIRIVAVVATALFLPIGYIGLIELLSKPKPMSFEWFRSDAEFATVLGVSFEEGTAIYLWLRLEDELKPRYYVLPWRGKLAERLQEAVDDAVSKNSSVVIPTPFSPKALEELGNMNIQIIPPPVPPTKTPPFAQPRVFNPRKQDI